MHFAPPDEGRIALVVDLVPGGQTLEKVISREFRDGLPLVPRQLPAGSRLNPNTGVFDWTPTYEQAGTHSLTFAVRDPVVHGVHLYGGVDLTGDRTQLEAVELRDGLHGGGVRPT